MTEIKAPIPGVSAPFDGGDVPASNSAPVGYVPGDIELLGQNEVQPQVEEDVPRSKLRIVAILTALYVCLTPPPVSNLSLT